MYEFVKILVALNFRRQSLNITDNSEEKEKRTLKCNFEPSNAINKEFMKLYVDFCHSVACSSAELFNKNLDQVSQTSKNSVYQAIIKLFFRLSDSEYVLCGIDRGKGFQLSYRILQPGFVHGN